MNTKLHAVTDADGRPIRFFMTAGQVSDYTGAAALLKWLRPGGRLFVVRGVSPVMEAVLHVQDVNGTRTESLFETDLPYLVGAAPAPQFVF